MKKRNFFQKWMNQNRWVTVKQRDSNWFLFYSKNKWRKLSTQPHCSYPNTILNAKSDQLNGVCCAQTENADTRQSGIDVLCSTVEPVVPRAPNESVQNGNGSGNDNSYRLHTTHSTNWMDLKVIFVAFNSN